MEVYYDLLEVSKAAGITTEEEIEDVKSFDGTFQVSSDLTKLERDGIVKVGMHLSKIQQQLIEIMFLIDIFHVTLVCKDGK